MNLKNIVIVGGGFGGVGVAKYLAKKLPRGYQIVLINPTHHHVFHPDLYELTASPIPEIFGTMSADYIRLLDAARISLFDVFINDLSVSILEDSVVGIDETRREVSTALGKRIPYEYMVFTVGSVPSFFGIKSIEEVAHTLVSPSDSVNIRNAIDEVFSRSPKNKEINIVIVGAGFTGCELSAVITGLVDRLSLLHGHPRYNVNVKVIEAGKTLLSGSGKWVQKKTLRRLQRLGVQVIFDRPVQYLTHQELSFSNNEKVAFDILVWTAGVVAHPLVEQFNKTRKQSNGRVLSDEYLRVFPYEEIFGVGDIICVSGCNGKPLPMAASIAVREAPVVAKNILRAIRKKKLKKYKPSHPGFVIPLGEKYAVVDLGLIKFAGRLGWLLRELITLRYYVSILGYVRGWNKWKSRFSVFV